MWQQAITYEQPLNEAIRAYLRLEHVFTAIEHHLTGTSAWDSRAALTGLSELVQLLERADIKAILVKDLTRQETQLQRLCDTPQVNTHKLEQVLQKIRRYISSLHSTTGKFGQELKQNEFFSSVSLQLHNPGGACAFDTPGFHYWLGLEPEVRLATLKSWQKQFSLIEEVTRFALDFLRDSGVMKEVVAEEGFYQTVLDGQRSSSLVRITIPTKFQVFPEVSASRHRISINLFHPSQDARPSQYLAGPVEFGLAVI